MVHDLNPFAWRIYENFGVRWYGLSYMLGFIFAYILISWLANRQRYGLSEAMVGDFITYTAIGTLVGGRLGYCLFYSPDLFLKFKAGFPFWGVLAVNEGGMASHGGIIGIIIGAVLFARKNSLNSLYLLDLVAVAGPVGVFMGRIANFINGELVGREASANFPLAVKFPSDIYLWPAQDFDRLSSLADVVTKIGISRDQWLEWLSKFRLDGIARDQVYSTLNKIVDAIQSGNVEAKNAIGLVLTPRHPSQLYAAAGEGLLTFVILFFLMRKSRRPGFIAATFIVIYALVRISDEQFRMPDAHIGFQWLGLTRGQWLSVVMLITGVVLSFVWSRTSALTVPGWGKGQNVKIGRK